MSRGFGVYVGATMPAGPVTVGFEAAYVSGDDPTTAKNEGAFASDYQSPFWSIILFNNLDYNGYQNESVTGPAPADTGMKNACGIKASVTVPLMPGLSLYRRGRLRRPHRGRAECRPARSRRPIRSAPRSTSSPTTPSPRTSAGTVGGGYLVAGDFYGDVDNPVGVMSAFSVKF